MPCRHGDSSGRRRVDGRSVDRHGGRQLGDRARSRPSSVSCHSEARTVPPSMSRKPSVPSWGIRLCGIGRRTGVHAQRAVDDVDALDVAVAVDEHVDVAGPEASAPSTVRPCSSAGVPASGGRGSGRRARRPGRAATSSAAADRRRRRAGRPTRPRRCPAPTTSAPPRPAGRARAGRGCRRRGGWRRRRRTRRTPAATARAGLGDVGVGDQADPHRGPVRQLRAQQRDDGAVEHVGAGRYGHDRASFTSPAPVATWAPTGTRRTRRPFGARPDDHRRPTRREDGIGLAPFVSLNTDQSEFARLIDRHDRVTGMMLVRPVRTLPPCACCDVRRVPTDVRTRGERDACQAGSQARDVRGAQGVVGPGPHGGAGRAQLPRGPAGDRSGRGRRRTAESVERQLAKIDHEIATADPVRQLKLVQARRDLQVELESMAHVVDMDALEAAFVEVATVLQRASGHQLPVVARGRGAGRGAGPGRHQPQPIDRSARGRAGAG